jgi:hypothetical protein
MKEYNRGESPKAKNGEAPKISDRVAWLVTATTNQTYALKAYAAPRGDMGMGFVVQLLFSAGGSASALRGLPTPCCAATSSLLQLSTVRHFRVLGNVSRDRFRSQKLGI